MRKAEDFEIFGGTLRKYNGAGGAIEIPARVTAIAGGVFKDRLDITSVCIPDSVTKIEAYAFGNCSNLKQVEICSGIR